MIEVEKKFQPTEEQLARLLEGAIFLGEVVNHDVLYDYADYRLFKQNIRLRNRNGRFEIKIPVSGLGDTELEDEEEIKKYFKTEKPIEDFVTENLFVLMEIKTHRKKYKREDFSIDVDVLDSGYCVCEIELLVENENEVVEANSRIIELAKSYNWKVENLPSKRNEHLKLFRPDLYEELKQVDKK